LQKTEVRMTARSAARMVARISVSRRREYSVVSNLVGVDLLWAWHCRVCDRVGTRHKSKATALQSVQRHVRLGHK